MEILLAFVFGAAVGLAAHVSVARRDLRGVALGPVLGALVGGLVWMALTWVGLTVGDVWLWAAAIVAPFVVVYPTLIILSRRREAHDTSERERLHIG